MKRTMPSMGQGASPLNMGGRMKNPVAPSFGMSAPPMKKGGKAKKHHEKHEKKEHKKKYKHGGAVESETDRDEMKRGGHAKKKHHGKKKMKKGDHAEEAACFKRGGHVKTGGSKGGGIL